MPRSCGLRALVSQGYGSRSCRSLFSAQIRPEPSACGPVPGAASPSPEGKHATSFSASPQPTRTQDNHDRGIQPIRRPIHSQPGISRTMTARRHPLHQESPAHVPRPQAWRRRQCYPSRSPASKRSSSTYRSGASCAVQGPAEGDLSDSSKHGNSSHPQLRMSCPASFRPGLAGEILWSPVTESNRRPSPYHACRFRPATSG